MNKNYYYSSFMSFPSIGFPLKKNILRYKYVMMLCPPHFGHNWLQQQRAPDPKGNLSSLKRDIYEIRPIIANWTKKTLLIKSLIWKKLAERQERNYERLSEKKTHNKSSKTVVAMCNKNLKTYRIHWSLVNSSRVSKNKLIDLRGFNMCLLYLTSSFRWLYLIHR